MLVNFTISIESSIGKRAVRIVSMSSATVTLDEVLEELTHAGFDHTYIAEGWKRIHRQHVEHLGGKHFELFLVDTKQ